MTYPRQERQETEYFDPQSPCLWLTVFDTADISFTIVHIRQKCDTEPTDPWFFHNSPYWSAELVDVLPYQQTDRWKGGGVTSLSLCAAAAAATDDTANDVTEVIA
jgi:hypothetical protein